MSKPIDLLASDTGSGGIATDTSQAFLAMVGERVRTLREQQGMSRRVLSERSGVSPRYLVLLENGQGNTSLILLGKVAAALGKSVEWFVAENATQGQSLDLPLDQSLDLPHDLPLGLPLDLPRDLLEAMRSANASQRQRMHDSIRAILQETQQIDNKCRRICLIGLRGAGKSTLGPLLGAALSMPFIELNQEIENLSGLSVSELISLYGQEGYRELESQAMHRISRSTDAVVLAAAGGIVSSPDTFDFMLKHYHSVWIKATPDEHMQRVLKQGDRRPMADNPQAMAQLTSLLTNREAQYSRADARLDTSNKSLVHCQTELVEIANSRLDQPNRLINRPINP